MIILELLLLITVLIGATYFAFFSKGAQSIARAAAERKMEVETENENTADGFSKRLDKIKTERKNVEVDLNVRKTEVAAEADRLAKLSQE